MTCIVAVKTKDGVLMGGDSLGSNGYTGTAYRSPKVFRISPEIVAGYTSSFRMGQLLEHHLTPPLIGNGDELRYAIRELIPRVRDMFKSHGYAHVLNNEESGGVWLLAIRARLFLVQSDYSVLETLYDYDAVGSGQDFAMGAMYALQKTRAKNPRAFLKAALDAASEFAVGVAPPYSFVKTSL